MSSYGGDGVPGGTGVNSSGGREGNGGVIVPGGTVGSSVSGPRSGSNGGVMVDAK